MMMAEKAFPMTLAAILYIGLKTTITYSRKTDHLHFYIYYNIYNKPLDHIIEKRKSNLKNYIEPTGNKLEKKVL